MFLTVHHNATKQRKFRPLFGLTLDGVSQCRGYNTDRGIDSSSLLLTQLAYVNGVNISGYWHPTLAIDVPVLLAKCFTIMSISLLM